MELLAALETGGPLDGIKGLTWRKDGQVVSNPDRPLTDPNQFPVLPYEKVDVPALPGPHHAGHAHHLLPFQPGLPVHLLLLRRDQDLLGPLAAGEGGPHGRHRSAGCRSATA